MAKKAVTVATPKAATMPAVTDNGLPAKFDPDAKYAITVHRLCYDGTFAIRPRGTYHASGVFAEQIRDNIATCKRI